MELRPYQKEAVNIVLNNSENSLLQLATAAGKSAIIAEICRQSKGKVLVLAHRASLIFQNQEAYTIIAQELSSIYCAELGEKCLKHKVVFASRASLANCKNVPQFDLIIIDEVHLLNEELGQYYNILNEQGVYLDEPRCKLVGLTATPWRSNVPIYGQGKLFPKLNMEILPDDLVQQGFLAPYIFPKAQRKIDAKKCKIVAGDYQIKDLELITSSDDIIRECLKEWHKHAANRLLTMFFCVSVAHSKRVAEMLVEEGYLQQDEVMSITGDTDDKVELISSIQKNLQIRALCSCEVMTTGTNIPRIDCVTMLRPTMSAALHVQMFGRGTRLSEGKVNCLMIDIAGNMQTFGSMNRPYLGQKGAPLSFVQKEDGEFGLEGGVGQTKICQFCKTENKIAARQCYSCNNLFIKKQDVFETVAPEFYEVIGFRIHKEAFTTYNGKYCAGIVDWITADGVIKEYFFTDYKYKKIKELGLGNVKKLYGELKIIETKKVGAYIMINPMGYLFETVWKNYCQMPNISKYWDFYGIKEPE